MCTGIVGNHPVSNVLIQNTPLENNHLELLEDTVDTQMTEFCSR